MCLVQRSRRGRAGAGEEATVTSTKKTRRVCLVETLGESFGSKIMALQEEEEQQQQRVSVWCVGVVASSQL